jgi:hypothetical protein
VQEQNQHIPHCHGVAQPHSVHLGRSYLATLQTALAYFSPRTAQEYSRNDCAWSDSEPAKGAGAIVKESLRPGIEHELRFRVPSSKTVPALYPEAADGPAPVGTQL